MIRFLFGTGPWIAAGLIIGLAVHIVSVFALPRLAPADARARLASVTPLHQLTVLDQAGGADLPLADPAFVTAVCRFDLSSGVFVVQAPTTSHYTAVSIYTDTGIAIGAVNDRVATRGGMVLFVMTAAQRREIAMAEDETRADNLILVSPSVEGFALVRALVVQPGFEPLVREQLSMGARCQSVRPERPPGSN